MWLVDRIYRFLSSADFVKAVADRFESGLCIDDSALNDILYANFERRVGTEPRPINKSALRAYYEKYKHLIVDREFAEYIDELSEEYL